MSGAQPASRDARGTFERILRAALAAVEPGAAVRAAFRHRDGWLEVGGAGEEGGLRLRVADYRRAIVVGAGKATAPMAASVETVLAEAGLPVEGVVSVRYGHAAPTQRVRVCEAGHPIPDQAGVDATAQMVDLLEAADARDLVVCAISGGGSALLTLPEPGLTLADLQATTDLLLRSGAAIQDINTVRKHLDAVKGGSLARRAAPATLVSLVLSDVVGNPLDAIASGPTVPDRSTWHDAYAVLERYGLLGEVPEPVAQRLAAGLAGRLPDTPKPGDPLFERTRAVVVGSNLVACQAAAAQAEREGLRALVLSTFLEGEAREVGRVLAGLLREVAASGHPLPRPCCLLAGGETTVTVRGPGRGGRNQEVALGAAAPLSGLRDVLLASVGTDGSDGPTDAAGALVDGTSLERAGALGLDPARHLAENDAYRFFAPLGDLVQTGPTNTNVNDLFVLLAL